MIRYWSFVSVDVSFFFTALRFLWDGLHDLDLAGDSFLKDGCSGIFIQPNLDGVIVGEPASKRRKGDSSKRSKHPRERSRKKARNSTIERCSVVKDNFISPSDPVSLVLSLNSLE